MKMYLFYDNQLKKRFGSHFGMMLTMIFVSLWLKFQVFKLLLMEVVFPHTFPVKAILSMNNNKTETYCDESALSFSNNNNNNNNKQRFLKS